MAPSPSTLIYGVTVPAVFLAIASARPRRSVRIRCLSQSQLLLSSTSSAPPRKTSAVMDSLRVLEWEKLCDCVASFAGTQLGREATKEKLLSLDMRYDESMRLLEETTAAVEMAKWGVGGMDFSGVNALMVKSAIERAMRGFPLTGMEAIATASLILLAETLQLNLKASIKEDIDRQNQFLPLAEVIMEMTVNRSFVDMVYRLIDDDGSVKDSASSDVRRFREQVRLLEKKLYHLMDKLARTDKNGASSSEVNIVNGRWCLKLISSETANYEGLLLSSGTGFGSLVEPLAAIPLNDELQQARSLVSRAEEDVLSKLTDKMLAEVQDIGQLLDTVIRLDVIFARAKYGMAYGGTFPDLLLSNDEDQAYISRDTSSDFFMGENRWKLYMRKAYHPLLLHQHKENLQRAKKDVTSTITEIRRRKSYDGYITSNDDMESKLASLKQKVAELEEERPVPVDFLVSAKTNVVVVTGPNTGGKTISLKTIGLASLMAKSGLYVLADEPVRIPWFDSIFADIGDEQSLSQSLSTFSGHLKQINAIQSNSTKQSLVLLDEVGAGTNPLEGAALGMSILESFAERGSLLTVATTHHGELKTLKYSNNCFENACMEFDEVNLKPTYKILWGVPGRSNAINIAERLGLPKDILDIARDAYGTASAEINEIITDMERYKQDIQKLLQEAQLNLMLAKKLHENLLATRSRINQHSLKLKARKTQAIFDSAALTRSSLRNILRQVRELRTTQAAEKGRGQDSSSAVERDDSSTSLPPAENGSSTPTPGASLGSTGTVIKGSSTGEVPKIGDMVYVASLGKNVIVLKVDAPKGEVIVQASKMKLRIKLSEIQVRR